MARASTANLRNEDAPYRFRTRCGEQAKASAATSSPRLSENASFPPGYCVCVTSFIEVVPSTVFNGSWDLLVDSHPQSLISADPTDLKFDYVRRMGDAIDTLPHVRPNAPITAIHIGAGGCSLPRYIAATRPRSRQQVLELDPEIVNRVRDIVPITKREGIRFRYGDAAETISKLPPALLDNCDLVIHDAYVGATPPMQLASHEFLTCITKLLSSDGICLVNVAASRGQVHTKSALEPFRKAFLHHGIVGDRAVYLGKRDGNLVFVGASSEIDPKWLQHLAKIGPQPAAVLD